MSTSVPAVVARELGGIRQELSDLKEGLGRVEEQTTRTNGRVDAIELERAEERGRAEAFADTQMNVVKAKTNRAVIAATLLGSPAAVIVAHFVH